MCVQYTVHVLLSHICSPAPRRYATFAGLAKVDPTDVVAAASGLPPIDSLDVWPLVSGATAISPRATAGHLVTKELLILGEYKYAVPGAAMIMAALGGQTYPNASTASDPIGKYTFKVRAL